MTYIPAGTPWWVYLLGTAIVLTIFAINELQQRRKVKNKQRVESLSEAEEKSKKSRIKAQKEGLHKFWGLFGLFPLLGIAGGIIEIILDFWYYTDIVPATSDSEALAFIALLIIGIVFSVVFMVVGLLRVGRAVTGLTKQAEEEK